MLDYTLEVYKVSRKGKEKMVGKFDYKKMSGNSMMEEMIYLRRKFYQGENYRMELHETYIEQVNAMTGERYMERYDTPYSCSASSEAYWSS
jgi:hypothetical protein